MINKSQEIIFCAFIKVTSEDELRNVMEKVNAKLNSENAI